MSSRLLDLGSVPLKRKPVGNVWANLARMMQVLLILAVVAGIFACFMPVIRQVQRLQNDKANLEAQTAAEQSANRQLNRQFDLLKSNPEYIERISRDSLNLGKPGEMIFRFDPYPAKSAASAVPMVSPDAPAASAP